MIIKSSYKDYYDHVAHLYGGGDPKIVYVRHRLKLRDREYGDIDRGVFIEGNTEIKGINPVYNTVRSASMNMAYTFKWLVIAGKCYLLIKHDKDVQFKLFERTETSTLYQKLVKKPKFGEERKYEQYIGVRSDDLVELSRKLNAPVFCIRGSHYNWETKQSGMMIDGDIPILANLGIPKIISPEQMYQNLSYFLGNTINGNPDAMPIGRPPLTDKERVLSHGFDTKESFRHRI